MITKEDTLKAVQQLQLEYLGEVDIQVRMEIATRKDQGCTMLVTYCNYRMIDTQIGKQIDPKNKSKLFIHKLYWNKDNENELQEIKNEIENLRIQYNKK